MEAIRSYSKKNKKIKLIHISTDEVYGDITNQKIRSNEKYVYKPSSPYSASKASADHIISSYIRTYKLQAVISNCCNNYGPGQFPEKLIPKMIFNITNNKALPVYGYGRNSREWIHVKDHCEALLKLYLKGKSGHSYNVGSGKNLRNLDLVKKILSIMKRQAKKYKYPPCIRRRHRIHAEPITFGLKLASFYEEFKRNRKRLQDAIKDVSTCAISGAVGTFANIDPRVEAYVSKKLKLRPEPISTQFIPRDRHAFYFSVLGSFVLSFWVYFVIFFL